MILGETTSFYGLGLNSQLALGLSDSVRNENSAKCVRSKACSV